PKGLTVAEQDEVVQIRVGQFSVGIVGLKTVMEEAAQKNLSSDDEMVEYLFEHLRSKNYIPPRAAADYRLAFLREYKRYKGEPVAVEEQRTLEVRVLGPGCPNCDKLEHMIYKVMTDEGIAGDVEHVKDLNKIAAYGMVATPALVINGEVKSVGRLPRESQLRQWLLEAKGK
ncbi:MAG: thioredoxin family protein, partial [Syntrophobacterales bacterium]